MPGSCGVPTKASTPFGDQHPHLCRAQGGGPRKHTGPGGPGGCGQQQPPLCDSQLHVSTRLAEGGQRAGNTWSRRGRPLTRWTRETDAFPGTAGVIQPMSARGGQREHAPCLSGGARLLPPSGATLHLLGHSDVAPVTPHSPLPSVQWGFSASLTLRVKACSRSLHRPPW